MLMLVIHQQETMVKSQIKYSNLDVLEGLLKKLVEKIIF